MFNPKITPNTRTDRLKLSKENWDYYAGNQFNYWIGSLPSPDDPNRDRLINELERIFISANLIRECLDRHVDALIADFPTFKIKPSEEADDSQENLEYSKVLSHWLKINNNSASQEIDDDNSPIRKCVIKALVNGKGYLRLFTRERYKSASNNFKKISMHCPTENQVEMIYDDEGSLIAIEYTFDNGRIERQELDPLTGILHFFIYANVESKNRGVAEDEYDLDLNFQWSIFELKLDPLITASIKQQQNGINLVLTMLSRNVISAGFLERLILNGQTPGRYEDDPATGNITFVPDPRGFATGAGAVNVIQGLPLGEDPLAPEGYTNPSAVFRDPVDVTCYEKSLNIYVARIYYEMGQGHILTTETGVLSGVSRIQLSHDFKNTVQRHKIQIESLLNNVFFTVLMMLSYLGEPLNNMRNMTMVTELNLSHHLVTPEEHAQIREDYKASILSLFTVLRSLGVDDIPGEIERIEAERKQRMEELQQTFDQQIENTTGATPTKPNTTNSSPA